MGLFRNNLFLVVRGFESSWRRDGSVLEGTICKQFVSKAKNRKNLKPCRGFKSFRLNNGLFLKNEFFKISWVRILSKKGWTDFVVVSL